MLLTDNELAYKMDKKLDVMNFLNEVVEQYPEAISFASGRPAEEFFDLDLWLQQLSLFVTYYAQREGVSEQKIKATLSQYGKTNGIINELIARSLLIDENIDVSENQIVVTNGAQEAMAICIDALFKAQQDVLIVTEPTYIGITGLASVNNVQTHHITVDEAGPDLVQLKQAVEEIAKQGKKAKALYLIADFNNPLGSSISKSRRLELLEFCSEHQIIIIEDNPYGLFRYEGENIPTLMSLDKYGQVIYIGSFAKTICPGARVGYIASKIRFMHLDQEVNLTQEFSKVKSLLTVNTSQIAQAIVGGVLLAHDCSLKRVIVKSLNHYKSNRDKLLNSLDHAFSDHFFHTHKVCWNQPEGGFFITISLPFVFTDSDLECCAEIFGLIVTPLRFFSRSSSYDQSIRISFSYVKSEEIELGVARLAQFIKNRIEGNLNGISD